MTKVYSRIPPRPPHFGKLQIWDDQSLLRNTPPPLHFRKLQIWDDQSLLRNTPPFRKTSDWDNQSLLRNPPYLPPPPPEFKNAESYYMWRLYPTRITTRCNHHELHTVLRKRIIFDCYRFYMHGLCVTKKSYSFCVCETQWTDIQYHLNLLLVTVKLRCKRGPTYNRCYYRIPSFLQRTNRFICNENNIGL